MATAQFKDLCMDADDPVRLGVFWTAVLDLSWQPKDDGAGLITGPAPQHTIWVNDVPESKSVKHRVHLDVYARQLADLTALGATVLEHEPDWTVMTDPEGGEFCAFLRDDLPPDRIRGLVVDSAHAESLARWWAGIYGVRVTDNGGWFTLAGVPGMPGFTMDFVPVPEPKTAKNRLHWDVTAADLAPLVDAGATVLRERDDDIGWHVLADPEGNEFCAFRG